MHAPTDRLNRVFCGLTLRVATGVRCRRRCFFSKCTSIASSTRTTTGGESATHYWLFEPARAVAHSAARRRRGSVGSLISLLRFFHWEMHIVTMPDRSTFVAAYYFPIHGSPSSSYPAAGSALVQLHELVVKLVPYPEEWRIYWKHARCNHVARLTTKATYVRNGTQFPRVSISRKRKVVDETFRVLRIVGTLSSPEICYRRVI
jgi:hypothetical protein